MKGTEMYNDYETPDMDVVRLTSAEVFTVGDSGGDNDQKVSKGIGEF